MSKPTPMMEQYNRIKQKYKDAILFFRLGDFYEMFQQDAREASSLLGLTLTQRNGVPMCGIPFHASQGYIARLLKAGKKIAICEQLHVPPAGKGLADRDVVEVITPGTVTDEELLDRGVNNYLAALAEVQKESLFPTWTYPQGSLWPPSCLRKGKRNSMFSRESSPDWN